MRNFFLASLVPAQIGKDYKANHGLITARRIDGVMRRRLAQADSRP